MARFLEPPPRDFLVSGGFISSVWLRWVTALRDALNLAPQRVAPALALTGQTAAIATTALPLPALGAGYYRVSVFAVGVAVSVVIGFTLDATARTLTLPAASPLSGAVFVEVDAGSDLTYAVTPSAAGTYDLVIVVERVEA